MIQRQLRGLILPLLVPAVVLHAVFFLIPALNAFYYSLTSWSGITHEKPFVGLDNYVRALNDMTFLRALGNVLFFGVLGFLLTFPLSLLFAVVLAGRPRGERLIKFIVFAPTILSVVVTAVLWGGIYNPVIGLLNETLDSFGLGEYAQPWLGRWRTAMPAITVAMVWQGLGTYVILFLAGLQKIPPDIYESAQLDGASRWSQFWHITMPLLWDVVHILVLLWLIGAVQIFALIFVMTRGYSNVTEVLGTYLYWTGFQGQSVGYASAMGVIMFIIVMTLSLVVTRVMRRETYEY